MSESESLFDNLLRRRVFQFVGMYIAATWLVIELGDWVTDRFDLPANVTSYVFVAMLVLLPSVIMFAYGHGAPGKDRWTRFERVFIPLNVIVAGLVLFLVDPRVEAEAATQIVEMRDETGQMQQFEVPRQGYHRNILVFHFSNASGDPELDWLSYGLALMVAYDMDRVTPAISISTPFDGDYVQRQLQRRGYPELVEVPPGLALELARDRNSAALVLGSFDYENGEILATAELIDAGTGEALNRFEMRATDWLNSADQIAAALLNALAVVPAYGSSNDPLSQHFSASLDAIRHYTDGELAIGLENDFGRAIEEYESAVELDPEFAEARRSLSIAYYLSGSPDRARDQAAIALRSSYRLSQPSEFSLKANRYVFEGDYERGLRVTDIWTEVEPESPRAYVAQATLAQLKGGDEALDKAMAAYDQLLALNPKDYRVLRQRATLEQQRGDFAAAVASLLGYIDFEPADEEARLQLAAVYQASGDFDSAEDVLEDADAIADDPTSPGLALAKLESRLGRFAAATDRLEQLAAGALEPQQEVDILLAKIEVALAEGRVRDAIDLQKDASERARATLPPMVWLFTVENQRTAMYSLIGDQASALELAGTIRDQLGPPFDSFYSFTYSGIFEAAGEREKFRELAADNLAARDRLPALFHPFIDLEQAQIAIWDGRTEDAVVLAESAEAALEQSFTQLINSDFGIFNMYLGIAKIYQKASRLDSAEEVLRDILKIFPGNGIARLQLAEVQLARGDFEAAGAELELVLTYWKAADSDYRYLEEAHKLRSELEESAS